LFGIIGKWGKYDKKYNPNWEKEAALKSKLSVYFSLKSFRFKHPVSRYPLSFGLDWLEPSQEKDVLNGKPEAYCKLCMVHIRAHHSNLLLHASRQKHEDKEAALDRSKQKDLNRHGK